MFHTAYNSYESKPKGRDYIGKHSTEDPHDDYKGSFKDKEFDPDSKIVMAYAKTVEGARWFEINFHNVFDVAIDPQYVNRAKSTSTGFDRTGVTCSDESKKLMRDSHMGEKNNRFGVTHTDEAKQKQKEAKLGEKHPQFGKSWYVNAVGETRCCKEHPGLGWQLGRGKMPLTEETKQLMSETRVGEKNPIFGKKCYVNVAGEIRFFKETPGPEWQLGRRWKTFPPGE